MINITAVSMKKFDGRNELDITTEKKLFDSASTVVSNDEEMYQLIKKADPQLNKVPMAEMVPGTDSYETGVIEIVPDKAVDLLLHHLPEAINQSKNSGSKNNLIALQSILERYKKSNNPDKYLIWG